MQISLNSMSWVIFITKPQLYYNKANCNIYNPELMIMSQFIFFLRLKITEIQCDIKNANFPIDLSRKSLTSESYAVLKYFEYCNS
jgi:hypothetical protein